MTDHMEYLETIAAQDVATLREKERTYGGSWKKRGGVGAFMMLARKMDRLENIAEAAGYDIFEVIRREGLSGADGTLIAEIRDLRCYLMLVEAEMASSSAQQEFVLPGNSIAQGLHDDKRQDGGTALAEEIMKRSMKFTGKVVLHRIVDKEGHILLETDENGRVLTHGTEHPAPFGYDPEQEN